MHSFRGSCYPLVLLTRYSPGCGVPLLSLTRGYCTPQLLLPTSKLKLKTKVTASHIRPALCAQRSAQLPSFSFTEALHEGERPSRSTFSPTSHFGLRSPVFCLNPTSPGTPAFSSQEMRLHLLYNLRYARRFPGNMPHTPTFHPANCWPPYSAFFL